MNQSKLLEPTIIFEDEAMLVLNKPAGLVVNRANSIKEPTLQDWIEQRYVGDSAWEQGRAGDSEFAARSGMVHRLDKDTSGVLLFAKTATAMWELMRQFKSREVQKTYLALVHGQLEQPAGIIEVGIERHPKNRERFSVSGTGRPSKTFFERQKNFVSFDWEKLIQSEAGQELSRQPSARDKRLYEAGFSLVKLQPKTGRTHQLRVHLQFIHHPIVGDERYTGRKRGRIDRLWCARQWLHAWLIEFKHPVSGEAVSFEAELATDLEASLEWVR